MKKLTLSAEPDVIAEPHRLAELQGTSVSATFSRIVRLLSNRDRERPRPGRGGKKSSGLIQLPDGNSERDLLEASSRRKVSALKMKVFFDTNILIEVLAILKMQFST